MITEINLLPWRELKREQDKKLFTTILLLALVFAAGMVLLANYYSKTLIDNQNNRNKRLQTEIATLDKQIAEIKSLKQLRAALISRMMIVQNLQSTRILTVHLFDELIKVLPSGIYITKVQRDQNLVTVMGFTQSNTYISDMMRNIEQNEWIHHPVLTEIKKPDVDKNSPNSEFKLSFVLKPNDNSGGQA